MTFGSRESSEKSRTLALGHTGAIKLIKCTLCVVVGDEAEVIGSRVFASRPLGGADDMMAGITEVSLYRTSAADW